MFRRRRIRDFEEILMLSLSKHADAGSAEIATKRRPKADKCDIGREKVANVLPVAD